MPWWVLGWDGVCWLGHRRVARPWSVGQIRVELADTDQLRLSDDASERSSHRDQQRRAARQHDPPRLAATYADVEAVLLAIEGLQPEKGHETLYVVRALERKRVWCAEALLASATAESQQLLAQARTWAARLGKPVRLGMSETQEACVRGMAAEFPGVPHRDCTHHFLRAGAKPVLEADSRAQGKRRRTIRGLRVIEREVLADQRPPDPTRLPETQAEAVAREVVRDDCTAVRGILHADPGGPLHPPGRRLTEALEEGQASLARHLEAQKGRHPPHAVRVERATATGD